METNERRVRITLKRVPISKEEAWDRWKFNVECASAALMEAINAPLETEKDEHIRLKEGDPGFDEAPYEEVISFHPMALKPINHETDLQSSDCRSAQGS